MGNVLKKALVLLCDKWNVKLLGYPERLILRFEEETYKWKMFQELLKRGILWNIGGSIFLTYAFREKEMVKLIDALTDIIPILDRIELKFKPMEPIFKVR